MQGCHRKFGPNVALGAALEMFFFKFLIGPRMVLATVQQMPSGFAGMLDCLVLCFWHSGTSGFLEPFEKRFESQWHLWVLGTPSRKDLSQMNL